MTALAIIISAICLIILLLFVFSALATASRYDDAHDRILYDAYIHRHERKA